MGVTLPDKLQHFGIYSVGQMEEILNSKLVDLSVEYFNELIIVGFS